MAPLEPEARRAWVCGICSFLSHLAPYSGRLLNEKPSWVRHTVLLLVSAPLDHLAPPHRVVYFATED